MTNSYDDKVIAWTGGTHPEPFDKVSAEEQYLTLKLYSSQVHLYVVSHKLQEVPQDVAILFFNRARYDAHATFREVAKG
jgi:hypothetical protein